MTEQGSLTTTLPRGREKTEPDPRGLARGSMRWLAAGALGLALLVLVVLPLLALAESVLETGPLTLLEGLGAAAPSIGASVWTSLGAMLVAVAIGGGLALLTERTEVPGRRGLRLAMLVAFIVPGYVAAMGWLAAYGQGGLLDDTVGLAAPALTGPLGVVLVMGVEAAPIVYLIVAAGLATWVEPDLERAARAAGADAFTAFRTVTLPLLAPIVGGAAAIAFVLSITSFGVPAVLGIPAGFTTMTTRIYRDLAFSADPDSFARALGLAVVLAVGAALAILVADRLLDRRRALRSGAPTGPLGSLAAASAPAAPPTRSDTPSARARALPIAGGLVAWWLVTFVVAVPLLALLVTALARAPGLAPVPASWTLDNFAAVLGPRTFDALANSSLLAAAAAIGVVALSALAVMSREGPGAGATGGVVGLTFALPGSTLAVAVLLAYAVGLRDTLLIILIAYLAKFWALGYRPVAAGIDGIPEDLLRAARASGAGAWTTARTIVLPQLRPLLVAGGLIVFMFGLHEVTISSLLHGPGTTTLAVVVLDFQQLGDAGLTAALALVLTFVVAIASLPLLRRSGVLAREGQRR